MELIVLKVPPERVAAMIRTHERDLAAGIAGGEAIATQENLTWLQYRLAKYVARKRRESAA